MSGATRDERFIREHGVAAAIAGVVEPVLLDLGFRLVRVTVSGRDGQTVQVMAERPDGTMSADDCEQVSTAISPVIDVLDPIADAYRLEVSSPGIDRPLVRPTDFEDWAGYVAKIELKEPVSGRRRFRGVLEGFTDEEVRVLVEVAAPGETPREESLGFPVSLVQDARLVLTDDLVRESLRRAKKARTSDAGTAAMDGAEMDETDVEAAVPRRPAGRGTGGGRKRPARG